MILMDKMPYQIRFNQYRKIIERVFNDYKIPPEYGLAIVKQESNFKSDAINLSPGDLYRGGSYGLFQMSFITAQKLGFNGTIDDLMKPDRNCEYGALLIKELMHQYGEHNLSDIASAYNSGKEFNKAPAITRNKYVPNVLKYAKEFGWNHGQS